MNGTVLGFRPKEKGGKEGRLIRFLISSAWIRDPLRRNLLRKGRLQISSKKVEFAYFLILLKFRKALSRSCPHMKQSLRLGRTITPRLITPIATSRCRPNSFGRDWYE